MQKVKQRLLAGLLCLALFAGNFTFAGMQVQAAAPKIGQQSAVEEGTVEKSAIEQEIIEEGSIEGDIVPDTQEPEESEAEESETDGSEAVEKPDTQEKGQEESGTDKEEEKTNTEDAADAEGADTEDAEGVADTEDAETEAAEQEEADTPTQAGENIEVEAEEQSALLESSVSDNIASGSYGDIEWVIDGNGKLTVTGTGEFSDSTGYERAPWHSRCYSIRSAEINVTGMTDASYMFSSCSQLTSLNISGFDTSNVRNMSYMFYGCAGLTNWDFSHFDTSNVTDMSYMFKECSAITSLDVSGLDTSNVRNMRSMFDGCTRFTSLNVSGLDTSNVTDMHSMFNSCRSLTSLDVSGLDTSNVTDMHSMFGNCLGLENLNLSGFNTSNVIDMGYMFEYCESLESLDFSGFDESQVTNMGRMFLSCSSLKSLDVSGLDTSNVTNMNSMFEDCSSLKILDVSGFNTSNVTDMYGMFEGCSSLEILDVSGFYTSNTTIMTSMFEGCSSLEILNVSGFNTSNATTMAGMFGGCGNLKSLDVSGFDTSNVTSMGGMFDGCSSVEVLDVSRFDTSKVTYMYGMFNGCGSVEILDVSRFNTSNVTNMTDMFNGCSSLTSLNVSGFDTSKISYANMKNMFNGCSSLTSLDVSGFDTSNVTDLENMFNGCRSLTSLNISGLDTSKVTNMGSMFSGCGSLTSLNVSGLDTSKVTNMGSMFSGCSSLESLDVSGFDTSKVTSMESMFSGCSSLISLNLRNFDVAIVGRLNDMFAGCNKLSEIYTPRNLMVSVALPTETEDDIWYTVEGTEITRLPRNLNYGILIAKNKIPVPSFYAVNFIGTGAADIAQDTPTEVDKDADYTFTLVKLQDYTYTVTVSMIGKDIVPTVVETGNTYTISNITADLIIKIVRTPAKSANIAEGSYGNIKWVIDGNGKLTVTGSGDFAETYQYIRYAPWYDDRDDIISAEIKVKGMTDASWMFSGCHNMTSLDISGFDTSKVTDMYAMFSGCDSLSSLDISGLNTSKVVDMSSMFSGSSLISLNIRGIDTSNVIDMSYMFEGCSNLLSLDMSGLDTSQVIDMKDMFRGCSNLTNLNINGIDTSQVEDMRMMFAYCDNLTSLDLSGFDVGQVEGFGDPFYECNHLSEIYTPRNLKETVALPVEFGSNDVWYKTNGQKITELPKRLSYSILIAKNKKPDDSVCKVAIIGSGEDDIAQNTPTEVNKGEDYTFTLVKAEGYAYTVTVSMGGKDVSPAVDETGSVYTIPSVTANLVITIKKTSNQSSVPGTNPEPGTETDTAKLQISFVNENDNECTYTGKALKPEIKVSYNGNDLSAGVDYTLKYSNNTQVGTATIKITGKGNFNKSNSQITFQIVEKNIGDKDITLGGVSADADEAEADGDENVNGSGKETLTLANAAKLAPVMYYNNIKLTGKDYVVKDINGNEITNKKLGESDNGTVIRIEGKLGGNYTGSRAVILNVVDKKKLTKFTVTVDKTKINALYYDKNAHYIHEIKDALKVTAKDAGKTPMDYGKDYTIVYPNDLTSAGAKKFTVVGMGLYTGSISKSYTIKPAKNTELTAYYDGAAVTGNKISSPFTFVSSGVTFNSKLAVKASGSDLGLVEGRDYKVSYSGNKKANQNAKCNISFLGNYKGHAKITIGFEIGKADLTEADVIIADQSYKNKAGIYKSTPYVIEDMNGANALISASNYKVTYYTEDPTDNASAPQMKGSNKVDDGATVWVKLTAKGKNYSGEKIVSYKVRQAQDLSKAKITFKDAEGNTVKSTPYIGGKITSAQIRAAVEVGGAPADDTALEVIYVNNTNKGKATVIVKGTDADGCIYAGCRKATFSIVARGLDILNCLFGNT